MAENAPWRSFQIMMELAFFSGDIVEQIANEVEQRSLCLISMVSLMCYLCQTNPVLSGSCQIRVQQSIRRSRFIRFISIHIRFSWI